MGKSTPGPWYATYDNTNEEYDVTNSKADKNGEYAKIIATVWSDRPSLKETAELDAKLIAAAPELLSALRRAIAALNCVLNFNTPEGIKSYTLLSELDKLVNQFETEV